MFYNCNTAVSFLKVYPKKYLYPLNINFRSAETVGNLAESSQTVQETKEEFQGMGSIIGRIYLFEN